MKPPELHYATDRRCYQGAMCSDLRREIDSRENLLQAIKERCPTYSCTYFPMEGKYLSFVNHYELTGRMFEDKGQCMLEAWEYPLEKYNEGAACPV